MSDVLVQVRNFPRVCFLLSVLLALPSTAYSLEIDKSLFGDYHTALVILNRSTGEVTNVAPDLSARRLSPCSTFKIYNTLIGLQLGLISDPDAPWYHWDGVVRDFEAWNHDLTLREAFRVSAVPAFQGLAREIGMERMTTFIEKLNYGTRDLSAGIDVFWLPRPGAVSITISADEQLVLLHKLLAGELPFSEKNVMTLKSIMEAVRTEKGTLYGKTGSGKNVEGIGDVGWYVGFLESQGTTYVFACNITGGESPSGKTAREIVENVFKNQGLL